jgi:prepilin-type processing-associated H-X9-DG protein
VLGLKLYIGDNRGYPSDVQPYTSITSISPGVPYKLPTWYQRLGPYTRAQWPNWNTASNCFVPDRPVLGCPAYDRIPGRVYGPYAGSYGYNGGGVWPTAWDGWGTTGNGLGLIPDSGLDLMVSPASSPPGHGPGPRKEGDVVRPSDMIAMGDSPVNQWGIGPGGPYGIGCAYYSGGPVCLGAYNLSPVSPDAAVGAWYLAGIAGTTTAHPAAPQCAQAYLRRHATRLNISFCDGHVECLRIPQIFDFRQDAVLKLWNVDNLPHREALSPALP